MQVASSIFKAYDIRGVVPSTVTGAGRRGHRESFWNRRPA